MEATFIVVVERVPCVDHDGAILDTTTHNHGPFSLVSCACSAWATNNTLRQTLLVVLQVASETTTP